MRSLDLKVRPELATSTPNPFLASSGALLTGYGPRHLVFSIRPAYSDTPGSRDGGRQEGGKSMYRPVGQCEGGRFVSLTPEIDRRQEYWENIVAMGLTQIKRCEDARWRVRQAVEERRVIPVDFERRPAQMTKPPKQAA